jgi:hypothetical protein
MSCRVEDISYDKLRSMIHNHDLIFEPLENQTREESLKRIALTQDVVEKAYDMDGIYVFTGTKEKALSTTITKYLKKDKVFIPSQDNTTLAELGTGIHTIYERILPEILKAKLANKEFSYTTMDLNVGFEIDAIVLKKIAQQAEEIIDEAIATQKKIDPSQQVVMLNEFRLIDPVKDTGGTGDVLFIYSDNTFGYFDFKNKGIKTRSTVTGKGNKLVVTSNPISPNDMEYYEGQIAEVARILIDRYGLKGIRQARPVVSIMDIPFNKEGAPGERYVKKLKGLITGVDSSYLGQIPLSIETTDNKKVNDYIDQQFALIKLLEKKKRDTNDIIKKDKYTTRIEKIKTALRDIQLKGEIQASIYEANYLLLELKSRLEADETEESLYMNVDELNDAMLELEAYNAHFRTALSELATSPDEHVSINNIAGHIQAAILTVKEKQQSRTIEYIETKNVFAEFNEKGEIENQEISAIKLALKTTSELGETNFYFKALHRLTEQANRNRKRDFKKLHDELMIFHNDLLKYGKSLGKNVPDTFRMIYNEKSGGLHFKMTEEFTKQIRQNRQEKNIEWLKKHFRVREDAEARITEWRKNTYDKHRKIKDMQIEEGVITLEAAEMDLDAIMAGWDSRYNVVKTKDAWTSDYAQGFLELKPEMAELHSSEEYKKIKQTPALLNYFNKYQELNGIARENMGVTYQEVPDHFIANVRADMIDMMFMQGNYNPKTLFSELFESFKIREGDYMHNQDPITGKIVRSIPKLFLNKIDNKSFDLTSNMTLFLDMSLNYKYMSEQEAYILALKQMMVNNKITIDNTKKGKAKGFLKKQINIDPASSGNRQAFDALVDYYFYGVRIQDNGLSQNHKLVKNAQQVKNFTGMITLAYKPITAASAYLGAKISSRIESTKGQIFSKSEWNKAQKLMYTDKEKALSVAFFFDMTSDDVSTKAARKASGSKMKKALSSDVAYYFLRKADEAVDHHIAVAMLLHYGFDADGNLKQLANLPTGTPSIYSQLKVDPKTKEVSIDNLTDNQYIAVKTALRKGQRRIKGTMSGDDINYGHTTLLLNMFMQFRTWMPGVARERISKLRYDKDIDSVTVGRYNALMQEYTKEADKTWTNWMVSTLMTKTASLMLESVTFGVYKNKVHEMRAKRLYNEWKAANPKETKGVTFEAFKTAKQAQLRALAFEIRAIVGLLLLIMALGGGDDDEPMYKNNWTARNLYRILNRTYTEISFFYDFREGGRLLGTASIPSISILYKKLSNWATNTYDETRDYVNGENWNGDNTGMFSRTLEFAPFISGFRTIFDISAIDREKER